MNLDLGQLGCSYEDLVGIGHVLRKVRPSHIYMLSMNGQLTLAASSSTSEVTTGMDYVNVTIPYKGKRMEGFVPTHLFRAGLQSTEGLLVFQEDRKPADWGEKVSLRINDLMRLSSDKVQDAFEYLLRVELGTREWCDGVIFTKGELITTDGKRMHIVNSLPNMIDFMQEDEQYMATGYSTVKVPARRLLGSGAASAVLNAVRRMPSAKMYGGYQNYPDNHAHGFLFRIKSGQIEVFVTSRPWTQTVDVNRGRPSGDENNAIFTVYRDHLESIVKWAEEKRKEVNVGNNKKKIAAHTTVRFSHSGTKTAPVLNAEVFVRYTDLQGINQEVATGVHKLICMPTNGWKRGRWFELDTNYLKDAVAGLGDNIQFVLPSNPVDGLQYCYVNPVYITGEPGKFAVVSPWCSSKVAKEVFETRKAVREPPPPCEVAG